MVVLIRDTGNKSSSTSVFQITASNITPTKDMNMVINLVNDLFKDNCDNYDEVRDHSLTSSTHYPRTLSLFSSNCNEDYAIRVQRKSDRMVKDKPIALTNSSQLEYASSKSQDNQVSKVADLISNLRQQCIVNVGPILNNESPNDNNVFNVQLNYDINQALDPESWNSNFWAILLHRLMGHLASDIKNIKDSLIRMCKYILSKSIEDDKTNSVKDFKGIGKAAWSLSRSYTKHIGTVWLWMILTCYSETK